MLAARSATPAAATLPSVPAFTSAPESAPFLMSAPVMALFLICLLVTTFLPSWLDFLMMIVPAANADPLVATIKAMIATTIAGLGARRRSLVNMESSFVQGTGPAVPYSGDGPNLLVGRGRRQEQLAVQAALDLAGARPAPGAVLARQRAVRA